MHKESIKVLPSGALRLMDAGHVRLIGNQIEFAAKFGTEFVVTRSSPMLVSKTGEEFFAKLLYVLAETQHGGRVGAFWSDQHFKIWRRTNGISELVHDIEPTRESMPETHRLIGAIETDDKRLCDLYVATDNNGTDSFWMIMEEVKLTMKFTSKSEIAYFVLRGLQLLSISVSFYGGIKVPATFKYLTKRAETTFLLKDAIQVLNLVYL